MLFTNATWLKLILGGIGIVVWTIGVRVHNDAVSWVGVVFVAAAFVARFLDKRGPPPAAD